MNYPIDNPLRVAAIEAGGTNFVAEVGAPHALGSAYERIPTETPQVTLDALRAYLRAQYAMNPFVAIGVSSFGPLGVDPAMENYGVIGRTPKPDWQGVSYVDALSEFAVPVVVDSDVNGAGVAEAKIGAALGCHRVVYVTVGTGIGGGFILNGQSNNGVSHPEMGHMRVALHPGDPLPNGACIFHGNCLEGLASGPAIMKRWGATLSELPREHAAHQITAYYLGQMCVNLALTLMPDALILGGGVMTTPGLHASVCEQFGKLMAGYLPLWQDAGAIEMLVRQPQLAPISGLLGAGLLAENALLTPPLPDVKQ